MFISSTTCVQQPLWAIKAQFSIRPNWASCSYSLFSVYFYLTSAGIAAAESFSFSFVRPQILRRLFQCVFTTVTLTLSFVGAVQMEKALSPILVTPLPIVTLVREKQP